MAQLRQDYDEFKKRDVKVVAIGPEDPASFAAWWHGHKMPFTGIGDPEHKIAKVFGQQVKLMKLGRMPAMVIVDKQGKIRFVHYGESMSDILTDEKVLSVLDEIDR